MSTRPANLGFIGCGHLMTTQHIQNAHKSDVLEVHTLCDINEERLQQVAAKYAPRKQTTDHTELLADPEIDLVVIAMNPSLHPRFAGEALEAGKHVYVEKPLGDTSEEALEVARFARDKGLHVAVGFNRRFAPAYSDLKPHIAGREKSALAYYRIADHERGARSETHRLHVEVCHITDVLSWLLDSEPERVFLAQGGHHNDDILTVNFSDGSAVSILSSGRAEIDFPKEHLEVIWDFQAVSIEDFVQSRYFNVEGMPSVKTYRGRHYDGEVEGPAERFAEEGEEALFDVRRHCAEQWRLKEAGGEPDEYYGIHCNYIQDKGWSRALEEMATAVIEGRRPANAGPLDAVRANVVSEAAMESARAGKAVRLDASSWGL